MSDIYSAGLYNMKKMENGEYGLKLATSTTTLPDFSAAGASKEWFYGIITATAAAVVTVKIRTAHSAPGTDATLTGFALAVGQSLKGKFDAVTVTSGTVLIHYGKDERNYI
jgi:hypothetical protein